MTESDQRIEKHGVPMWAQILIWLSLVGLLVLVGVRLKNNQTPMAEVGKPVTDFRMEFFEDYRYQNRAEMNLSDLRGKVVVVNIWASWCKPCEQEAPELEAAWQQYKANDEVVIIGVDYVDTPSGAMSYLTKFNITFPNAPDKDEISRILNRNMGVPETYIIDRDGVLQYVKIGPFESLEEITSVIDPLLP
jgi:cytochrome c biogenesis protein CcmG/thiol:disulfide interchange protein DsbE